MPKNISSPPSPQKLSSGYSAFIYVPFLAVFIFEAASGYYLFAHKELDFYKFFIMKAHLLSGVALFFMFFFLSIIHLKRLYKWPIIFGTVFTALSFYILMISELHPPTAFVIAMLMLFVLTWRYLLGSQTAHRLPVLTGVAAWAIFNLILASGIYVGGPMKTFRTDFFNTMHKIVGVYGTPLLFYHLLFRQDMSLTWKKILSLGCIAAVNAWLLLPALTNAKRFEANKVEKKISATSSAYRPSVQPDARFSFQNAKTCGEVGCHTEIYKEWEASTHRFSAASLAYKKVFALFVKETGEKNGAFCEKCHNPDSIIFPEMSRNPHSRAFFAQQGNSCLSCHLISERDAVLGNGFKSVTMDAPYLPGFHPKTKKEWQMLHYFIRTDLRQHRKNYQRRPFYQSPEYCDTCHKITVPAGVNGAKDFIFGGPYASWSTSGYAKKGITCQHCHMNLFEFRDPQSIERPFHARPDHRIFGINASLSFNIGDEAKRVPPQQLEAFAAGTRKWLEGSLWISKYEQWFLRYVRDGRAAAFDVYFYKKPFLGMDIKYRKPAEEAHALTLIVTTKDIRGGHSFPVSLFDMVDVWLEIKITDSKGKTIFQSGMLDKNYFLPKEAHRLGGTLVDKDGKPIEHHRVWLTAAVKNKRVIPPLGEVTDVYTVKLPPHVSFPLKTRARWMYRRANQELANWLFNGTQKTFPATGVASAEKMLNKLQ